MQKCNEETTHYKEDARAVKPVETKWQHKRFMMLYGGKNS